jgi:hypothetical protein
MRRLYRGFQLLLVLVPFVLPTDVLAQVCTLSVTGLNRSRIVYGDVNVECGRDIHSAPFGNWGVSSNVGKTQDGHQFDGWCHNHYVCDNQGNCQTSCRDGWYEWNSCTDSPKFSPPNCTLYNAENCSLQVSSQDINVHGNTYLNVQTSCPFDSDGDGACDSGGCKDISSYTQPNHFMSLYELDPFDRDDLVQTLYFPQLSVSLSCDSWGCPISGSQWAGPVAYDSPWWVPRVYAEVAIVVGWGLFRDPAQVCRRLGARDSRYNCR